MTAQVGAVELSRPERASLATFEKVIERGLKTFVEVGQALAEIRDQRLYRAEFSSFETYCEQRWQISRRHADRLLDAAQVQKLISGPAGPEINKPKVLPANEAQVRPLTKLLPDAAADGETKARAEEKVRETWNEIVDTAPRDPSGEPKVTAKHVEDTLARREQPHVDRAELDGTPGPTLPSATTEKKRRPLGEAFRDVAYELQKLAERVDRLTTDDRFPRNAGQVALVSRADLSRALDLLTTAVERIPALNEKG